MDEDEKLALELEFLFVFQVALLELFLLVGFSGSANFGVLVFL